MFRTVRSTIGGPPRSLSGLGSEFLTYALDDALLVIGPTGVFVVVEHHGEIADATRRAVERSSALRAQLSDRLAWVPFIEAIVTTPHRDVRSTPECMVVPADMIGDMIVNGPRLIDAQTLMQLALLGLPRVTM